mgnify:CR=1 FL=1
MLFLRSVLSARSPKVIFMSVLAASTSLSVTPPDIGPRLLIVLLITVSVALLIVANRRWLSRRMRDRQDATAVQASHVGDPLRLGGLAIFAGLVAGLLAEGRDGSWMPVLVVVSAVPAVLAGLLEDLGYGVSAQHRLAAAFVSAALAVLLLGVWVTRADLPGLDRVLGLAPLAVPLTLMLSAGFCHATNLVDGMNGLAATVVISASVGIWMLAREAGLADVAAMAAVLGAAMAGFVVLNWPFGTVFMGDAGSYGVGHVLIWIAILLAARAPEIAMPALVLILFWPFADTLHSIARRLVSRSPVFAPDRMHLHQKMRRCIEIAFLGGAHRRRSNPLATLALAPMIVMPVIAGVALADDAPAAWAALAVFGMVFGLTHVAVTRLAIRHRCRTRLPRGVSGDDISDEESSPDSAPRKAASIPNCRL